MRIGNMSDNSMCEGRLTMPLNGLTLGSCFVMMPFAKEFDATYDNAIRPAVEACGLECVRADEKPSVGLILDKITKEIEASSVCIADLSGGNVNVAYELGMAHRARKRVLLITKTGPQNLPTDLKPQEVLPYDDSMEGLSVLQSSLEKILREVLGSSENVVKQMVVPNSLGSPSEPFVIAASPLNYREARGNWRDHTGTSGYTGMRGTESDHVGIRGLIQAFGSIYGLSPNRLPDLLNPGDYTDKALDEARNIYCIGSPKANRWTRVLLERFYENWWPALRFKADPRSEDLKDIRVMVQKGDDRFLPPDFNRVDPRNVDRKEWDFGLLIRGPHPADSACMMMILAGRSAVGTEATCMAATNPGCVTRIIEHLRLEQVKLNDHRQPFWASVSLDLTKSADEAIGGRGKWNVSEAHAFQPLRKE